MYYNYFNYFFMHLLNDIGKESFQVPVVQKVDSAVHWINHYPLDSAICFAMSVYVSELSV